MARRARARPPATRRSRAAPSAPASRHGSSSAPPAPDAAPPTARRAPSDASPRRGTFDGGLVFVQFRDDRPVDSVLRLQRGELAVGAHTELLCLFLEELSSLLVVGLLATEMIAGFSALDETQHVFGVRRLRDDHADPEACRDSPRSHNRDHSFRSRRTGRALRSDSSTARHTATARRASFPETSGRCSRNAVTVRVTCISNSNNSPEAARGTVTGALAPRRWSVIPK